MKIDPESITAVRSEPLRKIPTRVIGYRLKDEDGDYYVFENNSAWYESDPARSTLFSTHQEALQAKRKEADDGYSAAWRIVKVVKKAGYESGYLTGREHGKAKMAAVVMDMMEKHHTGSNADTLNAIEAFLQDYLK